MITWKIWDYLLILPGELTEVEKEIYKVWTTDGYDGMIHSPYLLRKVQGVNP